MIDRRRAARRNGCVGGTRQCRDATVRHPVPIKKPAAVGAAGHGHGSRIAFCEGCDAGGHQFDVADGGPCCGGGCRVGSAHSLLWETSVGRNLITRFSTVNNRVGFFFKLAGRHFARNACQYHSNIHPRLLCAIKKECELALRASIGAARSDACMQTSDAKRVARLSSTRDCYTRNACIKRFPSFATRTCVCASHKSLCARTARTFSDKPRTLHSIPRARVAQKKKTRDGDVAS